MEHSLRLPSAMPKVREGGYFRLSLLSESRDAQALPSEGPMASLPGREKRSIIHKQSDTPNHCAKLALLLQAQ